MLVTLPFPPPELSPNSRTHWAPRARVKAAYREACGYIGVQARNTTPGVYPLRAPVLVAITYHVRTHRRYDPDNLLAWVKSGLDGLVDARLIRDDNAKEIRVTIALVVDRSRKVTVSLTEMV